MKLNHIILHVADVVASLAFYKKAFGLKQTYLDPSNDYGALDTGSTTLGFIQYSLAEDNISGPVMHHNTAKPPAGFEIVFTVDDVEKAYQHALTCGAIAVAQPTKKEWGQTLAYVRDPDGVLIELCSEMEQ